MRNVHITRGAFYGYICSMMKYILGDDVKILGSANLKESIIVFSGGEDINPALYKEPNTASYGINTERDTNEAYAINFGMLNDNKMFGICRGFQLINALIFNQKLCQDIVPDHPSTHEVHDGKFGIKKINSLHHQGVIYTENLPYTVLGVYNGIVEGLMSYDRKIHAVQFHPEISYKDKYMKDYIENLSNWLKE